MLLQQLSECTTMESNMAFKCIVLLLTVFLTVGPIESANILIACPIPAHSHLTLEQTLAEELLRRGHQVTFITPYPKASQNQNGNYTEVSVANIVGFQEEVKKGLLGAGYSASLIWENTQGLFHMAETISRLTYESKAVQELLNSNKTFDLMIQDYFFNDAVFGLAHHFKCPLVVVSSMKSAFADHILVNPTPSSYVPNIMDCLTKRMDFWQRLKNFLTNIFVQLAREFWNLPQQRRIFKNQFSETNLELDDVLYNASLILSNSHVSVNDALPHTPNIIEVGGFHVKPPRQLPGDVKKILDDAKDGAILFSLGTNIRSADLKPEVRQAILNVFSKIKQKVLWKFETDLPNLPKNVKIMKWLPQNDILAHPNIRAFITHGGVLSSIEAIYHGVPLIGVPVFGDQKYNMASAVENGYALSIFLPEITEEKLAWTINEIVNNPKYRNEAKRRSGIMRDQPRKPLDLATFWIEYVIRHQGAPQLRSAAINLWWYQRYMVDIFVFLASVLLVVLVTSCWAMKILFKMIFINSKKDVTIDSKKSV